MPGPTDTPPVKPENLASRIEGHHAAHLHCHVLVDPLAIAGKSDHALLAHLREALGEGALTRLPKDNVRSRRCLPSTPMGNGNARLTACPDPRTADEYQ